MNLVERAAKRLEELQRAGSQMSGDLAHSPSPGEAAQSLIERAVRKLEAANAKRPSLDVAAPTIKEKEPERQIDDRGGDQATLARRELKLGDAFVPGSTSASTSFRSQGTPHKAHSVNLDLHRLVSAGYLKAEDPESPIANEFRKIKRPLIRACQGKLATPIQNANRVMVTSSVPGEGKSFVAFNLALSIAMERDSTVLLIDADTTRRHLSELVGIASQRGLLDLLTDAEMEVSDALFRTNIERLTVLPAGARRRHATELLASEAMERLVEHLALRYPDRILIFDAPPLLGAPEPAVLASHMGQIIVVVAADSTTHKVLGNALTTVRSCPVVTTILNKASSAEPSYFYAG